MRLTLTNEEIVEIIVLLDNEKSNKVLIALSNKIKEQWKKPASLKKRNATKKAIKVKKDTAKDKIRNTINLMNLENKKININSVSKESGCSYNTVKKYSHLLIHID
jgi:hypothetical protein